MGELQLAIWTREFTRLRDGDRFFYGNADQGHNGLDFIRAPTASTSSKTLGEVILANNPDVTGKDLQTNVFTGPDANFPAATCDINYNVQNNGTTFNGTIDITNTSNQTIAGWTLQFVWAQGQTLRDRLGHQHHQVRKQCHRHRRGGQPGHPTGATDPYVVHGQHRRGREFQTTHLRAQQPALHDTAATGTSSHRLSNAGRSHIDVRPARPVRWRSAL
jgi:hypothetical protein